MLFRSRCNQQCRACDQGNRRETHGDAPFDVLEQALAAHAPSAAGVWLAGGEVSLRPDLPRLVERARTLGYRRIGVQTNGRVFAASGAAQTLRRAGLTDADVGLQGTAAVHDWSVQEKGAFVQAWAGARRLSEAGVRTRLSTVLTRAAVGEIPAITALAARAGLGQRWILARASPPLLPRLDLLRAPLVAAIERAWSERREVETIGVPLCILGAARAAAGDRLDLHRPTRVFPPGFEEEPSRSGYGAPCQGCSLRSACPGLSETYAAAWGWDEIGPVPVPSRVFLPVIAACDLGCAQCDARDAWPAWPTEPVRALRQRLLRAVGGGAREIVFAGASPWSHPSLPWVVRDAARLGCIVEVWGPIEPLEPTDPTLERLAGLRVVRFPLLDRDPSRRELVLARLRAALPACRFEAYEPGGTPPTLHGAEGPARIWGTCRRAAPAP